MAVTCKCPTFAPAFENESSERLTFWQDNGTSDCYFKTLSVTSVDAFSVFVSEKKQNKILKKKVLKMFGSYLVKFLPLQPFSEKKQTMVDILNETRWARHFHWIRYFRPFAREMITWVLPPETSKRASEKKTSENIWKIWNKVLTFATAFRKKIGQLIDKRSMIELHKQYK